MTRTPPRSDRSLTRNIYALVSDARFLQAFGQIIFLILVVIALAGVFNSIVSALSSRGLTPNLSFLQNRAGFAIAGAEGYSPDDSYWAAFNVGLRNTLIVVTAGLVGTTVLGIIGGIFLLSGNWLIRNITRFIVEILRNTPLLVQIFVWYFVVVLALPQLNNAITLPNEGLIALPLRCAIYLALGLIVWRYGRGGYADRSRDRAFLGALLAGLIVAVEVGFAFFYKSAGRNLYASGIGALADNTFQYFYLGVSIVILIGLALTSRAQGARLLRSPLGGLAVGQLIGGLLFLLGIAPETAATVEVSPVVYLSNRGLVYPDLHLTARFAEWFLFVVLGITVAALLFVYLGRLTEQTGDPHPRVRYGLVSIVLFAVIGWFVVGAEPLPATVPIEQDGAVTVVPLEKARADGLLTADEELQYTHLPVTVDLPQRAGLRFSAGTTLDQRYIALLLALVIYTAAFIAEIVRAGILAVPRGQTEAARALGLNSSQVLTMVILPQALRVIIPPLGNQYLNLAKNSSLALAIAYSDIFAVMNTVINQSGQAVTGILIIMVSYLIISLIIAGVMNWVNGRFQLVTR